MERLINYFIINKEYILVHIKLLQPLQVFVNIFC